MRTKDIAKQYNGLDLEDFESFLQNSQEYCSHFRWGFTGGGVLDDNVCNKAIRDYHAHIVAKREEEARAKKAAEEKRIALSNMLITSGFHFDGYTITKYSGYISGDDAISVDRGMAIFGSGVDVKDKLMESLVVIRRNALQELKEAAYDLGCNAVIGVDFDYLTLDPQTANLGGGTTYQPYVFGVTANGNAVVIEKNE